MSTSKVKEERGKQSREASFGEVFETGWSGNSADETSCASALQL